MDQDFIIFSGTANPALASGIAFELGVRLGDAAVERFPDGEVSVSLRQSVRREHVFVVQPTGPSVDQNLIELLCWADACRRASAAQVTGVVPYFGYARSDKRQGGRREPIAASMIAQVLQAAGVNQVITLDLHAAQIEGFFHVPVDSLTAVPALCAVLRGELPSETVVVSPDLGRVRSATDYAQRLGYPVAIVHKQRESGSVTAATHVVGDVRGRPCLIIDDMISTGGTIATSIESLLHAGAKPQLYVAATHGLLLEGAVRKLTHPAVRSVTVTDSLAVPTASWPHLRVVSVAPTLAAAIRRSLMTGSASELF